jgi:pyrroline-5-carboxylate reductase
MIVFLGGGRITAALLAGLRLAKWGKPMLVHDRHGNKLRQLKKQYGVAVEQDLQRAVRQAEMLIVAVRPDSVSGLLREIGRIDRPVSAVSLAAGIPISTLRARLGPPARWVRAMPSPVSRSGHGLTALAFARGFPREGRLEVIDLFEKVGMVLQIPESEFDAFTVTYSSSHGYHALAALAGAAEKLGLSRQVALLAAAHALADGIVSWRDGEGSLRSLLHEAATPGGIAEATMAAMDASGYARSIALGLRAGMARARGDARRG